MAAGCHHEKDQPEDEHDEGEPLSAGKPEELEADLQIGQAVLLADYPHYGVEGKEPAGDYARAAGGAPHQYQHHEEEETLQECRDKLGRVTGGQERGEEGGESFVATLYRGDDAVERPDDCVECPRVERAADQQVTPPG